MLRRQEEKHRVTTAGKCRSRDLLIERDEATTMAERQRKKVEIGHPIRRQLFARGRYRSYRKIVGPESVAPCSARVRQDRADQLSIARSIRVRALRKITRS